MLEKFSTIILIGILSFAFFTRVWRLEYPTTYVFDEVYHAVTAKLIAQNDPRAYEWWNPAPEPDTAVDWLHPPFAKLTQAAGMKIFGENAFGWRISSALFGVGVIVLTYLLAETAFKNKKISLLAAFLASLDGLLLVQSRIAMNDIHVAFFILLSLWLYLGFKSKQGTLQIHWRQLALVGVSCGLALASKWSGFFVLVVIGVSEVIEFWAVKKWSEILPWLGKRFLFLGILPICVYVLSYWQMFAQGKTLMCNGNEAAQGQCYQETFSLGQKPIYTGLVSHFVELHHQIWWYQTHLEAVHPYQSRPWQWFTNSRPVWYFTTQARMPLVENIYASGNSILFWTGGASMALIAAGLVIKKTGKYAGQLAFLLGAYLCVWLPWQLSPRIMFFYQYTPAVPLLCIGLAYTLVRLLPQQVRFGGGNIAIGKIVVAAVLTSSLIYFLIWYPNWTALSVPRSFVDTIYFALPNWQ